MKPWIKMLFMAAALVLATGYQAALAAGGYESPPTLQASKILPKQLLSGPFHTVREKVVNDGFLNHYQVDSGFGQFRAVTTPALIKLINELAAIDAMLKIQNDSTFAASFKDSGQKTVQGLKNLFNDPKSSLEGAATGLGSLFQRVDESVRGSGPSQAEDNRAQQLIGFSKSKREVAAKFKVDVYSANQVLQENLDRIAWADYSGGLGMGAVSAMVPGGVGLVLTASGGTRLLNEVIATTPPSELRLQNRKKLLAMGADENTIELFIANPVFSPRDQTILVAALEHMKGVKNRDLFVKVALGAQNRDVAFLLSYMAGLYAGFNKNIEPLASLHPVARVLYARTKSGGLLLTLPADYITYNSNLAAALQTIESKAGTGGQVKSRQVWTIGGFSPTAAKVLGESGWQLHSASDKKLLPGKGKQ